MSLKFKNILDNHCINIQDLADKVYVTAQTVRNWCRKDGTIPTIDYIYDIANILEEQPVTIAKAFIDRPDELPSGEQEFQLHDHSDWFLPSDYKYQPEILAGFLKYKGISGSGVMIYKNICWPFISVTKAVSNIVTIKYDYEDSMYQEVRDFLIHTHDCIGFVFTDKYANLISFGTDQIDWWKILSDNYGSTNLEMFIKVPIFEEMKSELMEKQKCIIRISILKKRINMLRIVFFLKDQKM